MYRRATDQEKGIVQCDECYDLLVGPGDFECLLTEPEDRVWWRDGRDVVDELNRLHVALYRSLEALRELHDFAEPSGHYRRTARSQDAFTSAAAVLQEFGA